MAFSFLFSILMGSGLTGILNAPPKDLASLLEPKAVLVKLEAKTDEASLLGYLAVKDKPAAAVDAATLKQWVQDLGAGDFKVRREAKKQLKAAGIAAAPHLKSALKHKDPEVKVTAQKLLDGLQAAADKEAKAKEEAYLKQLMAIRQLVVLKSAKAVPVLKAFAKTAEPTLAQAANEAIQVLEGKAAIRPDGKALLLEMATRLPQDTSFVVALDMTTNSKAVLMKTMLEELLKDPGLQAGMLHPNAMAQMEPEMTKGIITALKTVGNVRVDAVIMSFSGSFGAENGAQHMGFVFKGLYNPERFEELMMEEGLKEIKIRKQRVFHDRDTAYCALDKNTFLIAVDPENKAEGLQIESLLTAFAKPLDTKPSLKTLASQKPKLAPAIVAILKDNNRIGAAGALTLPQYKEAKANVDDELKRTKNRMKENPRPHHKFQETALGMVVEIIEAERFTGQLSPKKGMSVSAICKTDKNAVALEKAITAFDKSFRDMIIQAKAQLAGEQNMPPQFKKMFDAVKVDKPLFPLKKTGKTIAVEVDMKQFVMLQMVFFITAVRN